MFKTKLFLPDTQVPLHDKRTVDLLIDVIDMIQPDELFHVGDFVDMTQVGRWVKGRKTEFDGRLLDDLAVGRDILSRIRDVYDGPMTIKRGNHDMRAEVYLKSNAPALDGALSYEGLLGLDELEISYERGLLDVAPGWVMAHGDEGSLNRTPGGTAAGLATRIGKSVVCGHTHKAALKAAPNGPQGYNGKPAKTLWGMEVGNAMDIRKADYLKTGGALWQQAFGVLYVKGSLVIPQLVVIDNHSCVFEGMVFAR